MATRAIAVVTKIQGTFATTNRFLVPSNKKPFSSLQSGLGFGPLESNSCSHYDHPRSMFEKVTSLDDALCLFDEMLHTRPLPPCSSFTRLLDFFTKIKHFSRSIDCFKHMWAVGVPVNKHTASIVIKCYSRLYQTQHGFTVLGCCLKQGGIVPDTWTYNTLIKGFIQEDKTHEAERLFKKLIRYQVCEPNLVTYNTMITGLCKIGDNFIAMGLIRLMDGRGCKPNLDTYNMIIDSLCKDLMIGDAFKLFKGMIFHKSVPPNVATYNSLIKALCRLGRWDEVSRMLKQMDQYERVISPDIETFNIIVDALCKRGNIKEAEAVIDIMYDKFDMHDDTETVNSLISAHCWRGETMKAWAHFEKLGCGGYNPNADTFNIMLDGFCRSDMREANCFYINLVATGAKPKPNMVTRSILAMGHMLSTCMPALVKFPTDHPYICFIQPVSGINTTYEDALAFFRFMDRNRSELNSHIYVYNIVIDGAIKCGKFDTARCLFHELPVKGLQPDVETYTMMIDGFRRRGLLKDAKRLTFEMEKNNNNGSFDLVTSYDELADNYLQEKKWGLHLSDIERFPHRFSTMRVLTQVIKRPVINDLWD